MRKLIFGFMLVGLMAVPSYAEDAVESVDVVSDTPACLMVEEALQRDINNINVDNADGLIARAKKYALLSERGCPENAEKYKNLAADDLRGARAVQNGKLSDAQTDDVTDTYRRIQMEQAANDIVDKARRLATPAIDFILEARKVFEE